LIPAAIVALVIIAEDTYSSYYCSVIQRRRGARMKIHQLLPQLQTPEQNGGAAQIDALMSASAEGFK